jgi:alpha-ketoglutarate-dependent taurine dioxygenase
MAIHVSCGLADAVAVIDRSAVPGADDAADTRNWVIESREDLTRLLHEYGAILLRGFPIVGAQQFASIATAIAGDLSPYRDGNSPRSAVSAGVYTSTDYPASQVVTMHNELSYAHWWPRLLCFYCETPAAAGGESLLTSGTVVQAALGADVLARYKSVGISYIRNLHSGFGPGRSWQQTFETDDPGTVEAHLVAGGAEFRWKPDGGLWVKETRPAFRTHPDLALEVWFNQADQWHPSALDEATRAALHAICGEAGLPVNATFGDGQPLDEADLRAVRQSLLAAAIAVPLRRRDLLIVDNMLLAHGRAAYRGERRVLVGMA